MTEREYGVKMGRAARSQSRISAMYLGVDIELTPEETETVAIGAGLSPIADGVEWRAGLNLAAGTIVVHSGVNYQVLQGHISQSDWPPSAVPALFKKLAADCAEWDAPEGAHDAYMKGDKVTHGGKLWESTVDNNVWEPGVYGWREVT